MSAPALFTPVRILIVDDHPIIVSGCRAMLSAEMDCEVVSAASMDAAEALVRSERLDLCIVDLNIPGGSGFELCRRILARDPAMRIIVFSMNDDPVFAARAIDLGVVGYASKAGDPADLVQAVRDVLDGGVYLPEQMARSLAFARRHGAASLAALLNAREIEILRHLAHGKTLSEIALLIGISYKTVAGTCSAMRRKLGARTASDLVRLAIENKLAMS